MSFVLLVLLYPSAGGRKLKSSSSESYLEVPVLKVSACRSKLNILNVHLLELQRRREHDRLQMKHVLMSAATFLYCECAIVRRVNVGLADHAHNFRWDSWMVG